jgi:hypothetical protein
VPSFCHGHGNAHGDQLAPPPERQVDGQPSEGQPPKGTFALILGVGRNRG